MFASQPATSATSTDGQPPKLPPKRSVGSKASRAAVDMFNSPFTTTQTGIQSSGFGTDPFGATTDFGSGGGFAEFGTFPSSGGQSATASSSGPFPKSSSQVRCCMLSRL